MTDRYGEAVYAAVESDGRQTTQAIKSELGIGYNEAARYTERMVADGILSECDKVGRRKVLKDFCGTCEACTAPLFDDDDFLVDEGGSLVCKPAVEIVGPCYGDRVEGFDSTSGIETEGQDGETRLGAKHESPTAAPSGGDAQPQPPQSITARTA